MKGNQPEKLILLGEDDEDDRELLEEVFSSIDASFRLLFVNNGHELFSMLDKLKAVSLPCLIILDYNMPGMNGAEILREVNKHADYKNIPAIIWSTSGEEKYKQICLQLGALDYIIKPAQQEDLLKKAVYMLSLCGI